MKRNNETKKVVIHYVKLRNPLSIQTKFPKSWPTYRTQVVNQRHQTPQGQSVAKLDEMWHAGYIFYQQKNTRHAIKELSLMGDRYFSIYAFFQIYTTSAIYNAYSNFKCFITQLNDYTNWTSQILSLFYTRVIFGNSPLNTWRNNYVVIT